MLFRSLAFNATQRDAQLTQLDGWIATSPSPRLIGGDFQLHPTDAAYGQLASRFSDVWTAIGKPGPGLTQTVLPSADTAAMLFWALLASGQINMRKVDGWQTLATKPIDQPIDLAA